jgi:formylglycine-generating enzyme required for sulfatase activity
MGCTSEQVGDCYDSEKPDHKVTVSSFKMGKYEVTQAQWRVVMGNNPSKFSGCDNCPVENVSWNDIQEFIRKLNWQTGKNYRLPTEAEWEFTARGGNKNKGYKYASGNDIGTVAWYTSNSGSKTHVVGQKQANELGIYDMSGNVWEWCEDWYGDYSSSAQIKPKGPQNGSYRVLRGGSWNGNAKRCRVSDRYIGSPDYRNNNNGFRLVLPSP